MFAMKYFNQEKDDLISSIFTELKILGVKVPKLKKFKGGILKVEKPTQEAGNKIFGVSLSDQEWISDGEYLLPKFLAISTTYLKKFSTKEVGLFRKAGNFARQKKLRVKLEQGETFKDCESNDVASLLKQWLRELPEPLIPTYIQDLFIRCLQLESEEYRITACLLVCFLLFPDHLHTLKHLMCFLSDIALDSDKNKMGVYNLALIMTPNIFAFHEPTEKIKNDLVQQHTTIVKLLIENCSKIGEIPPGITFQCPSVYSDFDSSTDVLDSNPNKSKKKQKNGGHVQDIFSGFRKLVGQTSTPVSKNVTPENILKAQSAPRCALKRKADPDLQTLSPDKKQALSVELFDKASSAVTPKQKGIFHNSAEKKSGGHVRRKSIGALLRRKDRKRGKSDKLTSENLNVKCSPNDMEYQNETKVFDPIKTNMTSALNEKKENIARVGSIKKSVSDCYLPVINKEFSVLPNIITSSQGNLQCRPVRTPSYNLRSEALNNQSSNEAICLEKVINGNSKNIEEYGNKEKYNNVKEFNDKTINKTTKRRDSCSPKDDIIHIYISPQSDNLSSKIFYSNNSNDDSLVLLSAKRRSPRLLAINSSFSKDTKENSQNINNSIFLSTEVVKSSGVNNINTKENNSQKVTLTRQEGFVVKHKRKMSRNSENKVLQEKKTPTSNLRKSVSVRNDVRKASEKKNLRRKTRHGSLIRGQPNTVKSGLRSALPRYCSHESALKLNTKSCSQDPLKCNENSLIESPRLQNLDLSLNILLQNFCLSSPNESSVANFNFEIDTDNNLTTVKSNVSQHEANNIYKNPSSSSKSEDITPPKRRSERLSNNEVHKLTNLSGEDRSDSLSEKFVDCKRKNPKPNSDYFDSKRELFLSPLDCDVDTSISSEGQRLDDSCFKTPSNKFCSPDSVNWMSGSAFLDIISPPTDETINKRESIAMILRNNAGHVQAKVSLYDNNRRNTCWGVTNQTDSKDEIFLRSSSQKCYSASRVKLQPSKGYESANKASSAKNRSKFQKSPLPPPPKFILTGWNTPSPKGSQPLKEVTNLNLEVEVSPNKFLKSNSAKRYSESPSELKHNTLKPKKLKRNSFSGHSPYKVIKKVSRSESSPACQRKNILLG